MLESSLVFSLIYLGLGPGLHFTRRRTLTACREARLARGELVEPETFWGALALAFGVTGGRSTSERTFTTTIPRS